MIKAGRFIKLLAIKYEIQTRYFTSPKCLTQTVLKTKMQHLFNGKIITTNSVPPEPKTSSPRSRLPAYDPYPEPGEFTPYPQPISLRSILIPSFHLRLGLPSGLFSPSFPTKTLYLFLPSPMRPITTAKIINQTRHNIK
jgi:hypothetical protein